MKRTALLVLFVLLFVAVSPSLAQGDAVTPEPVPLTPLLIAIITPIVTALGGYVTSPFVTTFTGLLKHPFPNLNPRYIQLALSAGLTVAFAVAVAVGWEVRLQTFLDSLIVGVSAVMAIYGSLVGSTQAYGAAVKRGVPVLGYKPGDTGKAAG